jgi:hypothetical protein
MGAKSVNIFGDSKLTVQQVTGESQCLDGILNEYKEKCVEILNRLDWFSMTHIPQEDNSRSNVLAQQASGYEARRGMFRNKQEPMWDALVIVQKDGSALANEDVLKKNDRMYALTKYIDDLSGG